jgi:hypothetical protein
MSGAVPNRVLDYAQTTDKQILQSMVQSLVEDNSFVGWTVDVSNTQLTSVILSLGSTRVTYNFLSTHGVKKKFLLKMDAYEFEFDTQKELRIIMREDISCLHFNVKALTVTQLNM